MLTDGAESWNDVFPLTPLFKNVTGKDRILIRDDVFR
jgi:hypothetical protein